MIMDATDKDSLEALIAPEASAPVNSDVQALCDHLSSLPGVKAILFYGSGLWKQAEDDTVYDFYLLIDNFKQFGTSVPLSFFGALIPPNVYYLEHPHGDRTLRCKYAVMTVRQFQKAAKGRSFTPHIWARFCQPARIPYAETEGLGARLVSSFADSVMTFHRKILPLVDNNLLVKDFWARGLQKTYSCEIRSEKTSRTHDIFKANETAFTERTVRALRLKTMPAHIAENGAIQYTESGDTRARKRLLFRLQRPFMKLVVFSRFIKAAFTFTNGLEYAQWKIERQSGVRVEISEFQRRHPLLGAWPLLWEVIRRGGLK